MKLILVSHYGTTETLRTIRRHEIPREVLLESANRIMGREGKDFRISQDADTNNPCGVKAVSVGYFHDDMLTFRR